jgi:D-alanine-D-alanine ligase
MERRELSIGLTFDLRVEHLCNGTSVEDVAEFDSPETIEAIESALRDLGHRPDRIGGVQALVARLARGDRWDLVFNIAEGMYGIGRESQIPALLDAHRIPYTFSDPLVNALTLHKALAKRVLRDLGLPTAPFALIEQVSDLDGIDLDYPLFAKPVAEGTSKGIDRDALARSPAALRAAVARLLARYHQPVLVEEYLSGREFTVGILGTGPHARSAGALEMKLLDGADPGACTFRNKEECEKFVQYWIARDALGKQAEELALRAWRGLGCRDGGRVDLRADRRGRLQILEINPLAGLHPTHSDLPILWSAAGRPYVDLIAGILQSAVGRLPRPGAVTCAS